MRASPAPRVAGYLRVSQTTRDPPNADRNNPALSSPTAIRNASEWPSCPTGSEKQCRALGPSSRALAREESRNSGIYFLTGTDPETGKPAIYVGEAECIRDRIKSHSDKDFWNQVTFFVSKDENLARAPNRLVNTAAPRRALARLSRAG